MTVAPSGSSCGDWRVSPLNWLPICTDRSQGQKGTADILGLQPTWIAGVNTIALKTPLRVNECKGDVTPTTVPVGAESAR